MRAYWIVQLEYETWLAPWSGDPGRCTVVENAKRFSSRKAAERALQQAREWGEFRNAFVDRLKATVI
jgi:hypothetical protein